LRVRQKRDPGKKRENMFVAMNTINKKKNPEENLPPNDMRRK
jgi:hypothetical protein